MFSLQQEAMRTAAQTTAPITGAKLVLLVDATARSRSRVGWSCVLPSLAGTWKALHHCEHHCEAATQGVAGRTWSPKPA